MQKQQAGLLVEKIDTIEIKLWGQTVGYLATRGGGTSFEFEPAFKQTGLDIAPLEMPLGTTSIYTSREINNTFHGLPGVIADSLPDRYGMSAIEGFFKEHYGLDPQRVTVIHRLLYLGERAMGALEFLPLIGDHSNHVDLLQLPTLLHAAREMVAGNASKVSSDIIRISASPGGRQAKALIDFDPATRSLRSGFATPEPGYKPCILKLDGTRDGEEPNTYGRLEYVYALMVQDCGIEMPRSYLLEGTAEDGRPLAHFVVERFDRRADKSKPYHYGSLCGLLLRDFREKHSASYENYLALTTQLTQDRTQTEQAFLRALFNIVFRNQDDHTKNFGFVMDQKGVWKLAPAFDLNYVYGFGVSSTHQMTFAGKDDEFTREDVFTTGKKAGLRKSQITAALDALASTAGKFLNLADENGLEEPFAAGIKSRFRLL